MPSRRWIVPEVDQDPLYQLGHDAGRAPGASGRARVPAGAAHVLLTHDGVAHVRRGEQTTLLPARTVLLIAGPAEFAWRVDGGELPLLFAFKGSAALRFINSLLQRHGALHTLPAGSPALAASRRLAADRRFLERDAFDASLRIHDFLSRLQEALAGLKLSGAAFLHCRAREVRDLPLPALRLSLNEWAAHLGVTRPALSLRLRRRWGVAPGSLLRQARLDRAGALLRETSWTVADVARAVGFSGSRAFIHAFKQRHGVTPRAWRGRAYARARPRGCFLAPGEPLPEAEPLRNPRVAGKPRVADWDGYLYRVMQVGLLHHPEPRPHDNVLNTMENSVSWLLTLGGEGRFEIGAKSLELTAGDVLSFHQPSATRWLTPPGVRRWDRLLLSFTWEIGSGYFNFLLNRYGALARLPRSSAPVLAALRLVRLSRARRPVSVHAWSRAAFAFLTEWHRYLQKTTPASPARTLPAPIRPLRLLSFDRRTIKNFARELGYSRSYLSKRLSEQWDDSPARVMRRLRMEEAAMMLRGGSRPIHFIAHRVGFSSVAAFCRAFRRRYGATPLQYRRERR